MAIGASTNVGIPHKSIMQLINKNSKSIFELKISLSISYSFLQASSYTRNFSVLPDSHRLLSIKNVEQFFWWKKLDAEITSKALNGFFFFLNFVSAQPATGSIKCTINQLRCLNAQLELLASFVDNSIRTRKMSLISIYSPVEINAI